MPRPRIVYNFPNNSEFKFYSNNLGSLRFGNSHAHARARRVIETGSNRLFGIEIEAFGISRDRVAEILNSNGILCYVERYNHERRDYWKVVTDSSIRPPAGGGEAFELVSPPIGGENGIETVVKVIDLLRENGAMVNSSCGLHVHVDMRNSLTLSVAQMLSRRFAKWEKHLDFFFASNRRESKNRFCRGENFNLVTEEQSTQHGGNVFCNRYPFFAVPEDKRMDEYGWIFALCSQSRQDVSQFVASNRGNLSDIFHALVNVTNLPISSIIDYTFIDRYRKLNLRSYIQHGTVEFRQLEGTLDSEKVAAWIEFCTSFVNETLLLSSSFIEGGGHSADTPSRYDYYLSSIKDHPFSGMQTQSRCEFILKAIRAKKRISFDVLNQAIKERNDFVLTLAQRDNLHKWIGAKYPSINTLSSLGYKRSLLTNQNPHRNNSIKLCAEFPEAITLSDLDSTDFSEANLSAFGEHVVNSRRNAQPPVPVPQAATRGYTVTGNTLPNWASMSTSAIASNLNFYTSTPSTSTIYNVWRSR